MKPNSVTDRNNTTFPLTDCNYYSVTLSDYRGRCVKPLAQPFRNISCQYFKREARRDFVGEAVLFAILADHRGRAAGQRSICRHRTLSGFRSTLI
jgi:hypothetical protein